MTNGRRRVRVAGHHNERAGPRQPPKKRTKLVAILTTAGVAVGLATGILTLLDRTGATVNEAFTDPLAVNVRYTGADGATGSAVVVPSEITADPRKGGDIQTAIEHYANHGGYVPKRTVFDIRLTGLREAEVAVTRIRAVEVRHGPPVNGTYLLSPGQGTGDVVPVRLDLDHEATEIDARRMVPAEGEFGEPVDAGPYPGQDRGDLTLGKSENARIVVDTVARQRSAEFKIAIDTMVDGEPQSPIVVGTAGAGNTGEPFRITAVCEAGTPVTYRDGYIWTGGMARSPEQTIERMPPEILEGPGVGSPEHERERWCDGLS
ncbi:hypothetical protein BAY61_20605 [Prauserella marina]|uniref:Uncharacterized protein n=1 Tax=Prauserella marina TaxID=530584 RepID=A0A222VSU6_9PSEU|nr:hypothetical protein [Prauserella marina]ASR36984.1 hypothetical protein BAY61_20605 [Prauserella marina]PWV80048.1 hypothetical protein DES30_103134 [Prauserella marina]SDD84350.1 hypothetical protein SAMN05421630_11383 [Prauserella marina]